MSWAAALLEGGFLDPETLPHLRDGFLELFAWNHYFRLHRSFSLGRSAVSLVPPLLTLLVGTAMHAMHNLITTNVLQPELGHWCRLHQEWQAYADSIEDDVGSASSTEAAQDLLYSFVAFLAHCSNGWLPMLELIKPENSSKPVSLLARNTAA